MARVGAVSQADQSHLNLNQNFLVIYPNNDPGSNLIIDCYKKNKMLPVVRPGNQSRRFTHINDTVNICYLAWKNNFCRHYSISNKQAFTIQQVALLFKSEITFLPKRKGERFASALTNMSLSNKIHKHFGDISLKDYVADFLEKHTK